jgi:hypothetical protein
MFANVICVSVVGFRPGDRMALTVTGNCHRVDREHRSGGCAQGSHEQPSWGLDRDGDRIVGGVASGGEHGGQFAEPVWPVVDAPLGDQAAVLADQGDVVVTLRPVDPAEHSQVLTHLWFWCLRWSCPWPGRAAP